MTAWPDARAAAPAVVVLAQNAFSGMTPAQQVAFLIDQTRRVIAPDMAWHLDRLSRVARETAVALRDADHGGRVG